MKRFFSQNECSHIVPITKKMKELDSSIEGEFVCMDKLHKNLKHHVLVQSLDKNNNTSVCEYNPSKTTECPDYIK